MLNYPIIDPDSTYIVRIVNNGFSIGRWIDGEYIFEEDVVESTEGSPFEDKESQKLFLDTLMVIMGLWGSKHDSERLEINVIKNEDQ